MQIYCHQRKILSFLFTFIHLPACMITQSCHMLLLCSATHSRAHMWRVGQQYRSCMCEYSEEDANKAAASCSSMLTASLVAKMTAVEVWSAEKVARCCWRSPACKAGYSVEHPATLMPVVFCSMRWATGELPDLTRSALRMRLSQSSHCCCSYHMKNRKFNNTTFFLFFDLFCCLHLHHKF